MKWHDTPSMHHVKVPAIPLPTLGNRCVGAGASWFSLPRATTCCASSAHLPIKVPFCLAAQTRSALHQRAPDNPLQETLLSNVQTPFSDPSRVPVGTGRTTPGRSLGIRTAPPRTRQEQRGHNSVTSRPRSRVRGGPSPPRAERRADAARRGGAESLVPRSGVSAPHSGGAESETGRLGLQPGSAGFGRLRAGRAGGGGRGRGQGRRAFVAAGTPVTGSEAGWSGADGGRWVGRGLTDGRGSQWRGGRLLAGGDWRVRACAEVARGAERRSIGCSGQGGGPHGGCEGMGAAARVTPKVEEASRGSRPAVSSPHPDGWKGGTPLEETAANCGQSSLSRARRRWSASVRADPLLLG